MQDAHPKALRPIDQNHIAGHGKCRCDLGQQAGQKACQIGMPGVFQQARRRAGAQARFKIGMFSRQTGKTFSTGGECADDCFTAWAEDRKVRWVILSRGERQAAEMMTEVIKPFTKAYYEVYNTLLKGGEPRFEEGEFRASQEKGPDAVYKSLEVAFPNGSRITALPANPDTARGFSANVILDEFAFHAKSREIWAALFPVISKGNQKLRVISTPNGKGNRFYELMTAEGSIWSRHVVDIYAEAFVGMGGIFLRRTRCPQSEVINDRGRDVANQFGPTSGSTFR